VDTNLKIMKDEYWLDTCVILSLFII